MLIDSEKFKKEINKMKNKIYKELCEDCITKKCSCYEKTCYDLLEYLLNKINRLENK